MNSDIPEYCDAIKKNGKPCRQKTLYRNWRCKFHGGLSTGPVTEEGKQQSRINGTKGGRPRKTQVLEPQDNLKVAEAQLPLRIRRQCARDDVFEQKLDALWGTLNSLRDKRQD